MELAPGENVLVETSLKEVAGVAVFIHCKDDVRD